MNKELTMLGQEDQGKPQEKKKKKKGVLDKKEC